MCVSFSYDQLACNAIYYKRPKCIDNSHFLHCYFFPKIGASYKAGRIFEEYGMRRRYFFLIRFGTGLPNLRFAPDAH